jgi:hypothetical protein
LPVILCASIRPGKNGSGMLSIHSSRLSARL